MIVKNSLLNSNYVIYQDDDWFKFSIDSVLLCNFVTLNLKCKKIMDLCCGNGAIAMMLSLKSRAEIYGVELQKCVFDLAIKSIIDNKMDKRINFINDDFKNLSNYFSADTFDTVVCNPPYFNTFDNGFFNYNDVKKFARHEINFSLDDLFSCVFYLLKTGGNFAMVHRTNRFIEIIEKLKQYKLEPKKIQFVFPKDSKNSDLCLIECTKNGKSGLKVLPNLILHNSDGSYCDNIRKLFDL